MLGRDDDVHEPKYVVFSNFFFVFILFIYLLQINASQPTVMIATLRRRPLATKRARGVTITACAFRPNMQTFQCAQSAPPRSPAPATNVSDKTPAPTALWFPPIRLLCSATGARTRKA